MSQTKKTLYAELKNEYKARGLTILPKWVGGTKTQFATLLTQLRAPRPVARQLRDEKREDIKDTPERKRIMRNLSRQIRAENAVQVVRNIASSGDTLTTDTYEPLNIEMTKLLEAPERSATRVADRVKRYLQRSLNRVNKTINKFSAVIYYEDDLTRQKYKISTVATDNINNWYSGLYDKLIDLINSYDGLDATIYEIDIKFWTYNEVLLGENSRATTLIYSKYILVSSKTKKNCLYTSLAICKNSGKNSKLLEISEQGAHLRKEAGRELRREIKNTNTGLATHEDIQKCSDYLRRNIKLYDNKFSLIKEFKTVNPPGRLRHGQNFYEIQSVRGHCKAMIKRDEFNRLQPNINDDEDKGDQTTFINYIVGNEQNEERETDEEIKAKKQPQNFNYDVATYDIETILDGKNIHRPYAIGMAYYEYVFTYDEKEVIKKVKNKSKKNFGKIQESKQIIKIRTPVSREQKHIIFKGFDCINKFVSHLFVHRSQFKNFTFYAHNGGKFDFRLIFNELINSEWTISSNKFVELGGAVISAGIEALNEEGENCKIKFLDSYRLMSGSLKNLCDDLKTEHRKLDGTVNHGEMNAQNCLSDPNLDLYLKHDILGLLEVIDIFGREVYDNLKIDITTCLTGASLSKKLFFNNYYNEKINPIYTLSDKNDDFIREGYNGGRVECFKFGEIKERVRYDDFTSLYPAMGNCFLPYGKPEKIDFTKQQTIKQMLYVKATKDDRTDIITFEDIELIGGHPGAKFNNQPDDIKNEYRQKVEERINLLSGGNPEYIDNYKIIIVESSTESKTATETNIKPNRLPKDFYGFLKLEVRTIDIKAIPIHSCKIKGRLIFPVFENWTELTGVYSEEINYNIYEYRFISGLKFKKAKFLKKFFTDCFNRKATAKRENKPALSNAFKIIANSGYGWWGLKVNNVDGIVITDSNDKAYRTFLENNVMINFSNFGDIDINRIKKTLKIKNFNVAIAAAISAEARLKLWNCLTDIKKVGCDIFYCDTDSIISNCNISLYPELMAKYKWDGEGNALGSLKNEAKDYLSKNLTKAELTELEQKEDGAIYFDSCIITGLKQYALLKTYEHKGEIKTANIVKLKGYSKQNKKLEYNDMKDIADGKILVQKSEQWLSGKDTFLDEYDPFTIKIRKITQRFKCVYTKGKILQNGIVIPLKI